MLTPEEFLQEEIEKGRCAENPRFVALAKSTVEQLNDFRGLSVIDYGAGTGVYANQLLQAGFSVIAQDVWKPHRDYMEAHYPRLEVVERPTQADFMVFIEVAEHMQDGEIRAAVAAIDPGFVLFSSTHIKASNDEEWGHINLKQQKTWDLFWGDLGYKKVRDLNRPTRWTKIYQRI